LKRAFNIVSETEALWEELESDAGSLKTNRYRLKKSLPVRKRLNLPIFLEGLGPQGISEVSLYRILPSGKQRFITSGPPGQFSELYVQAQFGEGDYLARAKLNGHWYKSKSFSVEAAPGTVATPPAMPSHDAELERLKAQIESQRLEMERERQSRELRNHELQLRMLEALGGRGIRPHRL
jgi:hypothetical protein